MKAIVAIAAGCAMLASEAAADTCWMHNGSLMRLQDWGGARRFLYEHPRPGLQSAGVWQGTVLFEGQNSGDWYSGTAAVFSSACPGAPLGYYVEGPVLQNPLRIQMRGQREVYQTCSPTGRWTTDTLVFSYSHQC